MARPTVDSASNSCLAMRWIEIMRERQFIPVEKGGLVAKHEIRMHLPTAEIVNRDVTFFIYRNGRKLGELKVSRGSLDWIPPNKRRGHRISWENFAAFMER